MNRGHWDCSEHVGSRQKRNPNTYAFSQYSFLALPLLESTLICPLRSKSKNGGTVENEQHAGTSMYLRVRQFPMLRATGSKSG